MQDYLLNTVLAKYIIPIAIVYSLAWLIHRLARRYLRHVIGIGDYVVPDSLRLREQRQLTLNELLVSGVGFIGYVVASIFTLGLFIDTTTLIWMIGLFSAAFGIGANRLIADFLTGASFIVEDHFDVGEKVQIMEIEGVIEKINLRTTLVRAPSGDLYTIPNGEIRVIRNFSRGLFSTANITLNVPSNKLDTTLDLLESVAEEAVLALPNLIEPWQIINETGVMGKEAELTLLVKAKFGKAAELRPRLLAFVQKKLNAANIHLESE